MRVTIISDASACPQSHLGAYGFWAVSERGRHAGSGHFKRDVMNCNDAEMMAVVNAIHVALNAGIACQGDQILVQTDSAHAIALFSGACKRAKIRKKYGAIVQTFNELKARHSLQVEFRHVKGHSKDTAARSKAQRHSDKRARKALKQARRAKSSPPAHGEKP